MDIDIAILSLFCAGGLFAYVREFLRLRRLVSSGIRAVARIVDLREDRAGSESVIHYLVKYEFRDTDGQPRIHEQDLNSKRFFDSLKTGDTIDVLHEPGPKANSYPVAQVHLDIKVCILISTAIIVLWVSMATLFALT